MTGTDERIIRIREVEAKTGLERSTIWRREKSGQFPQRVKITTRAVGWRLSEIEAWMANRPAA